MDFVVKNTTKCSLIDLFCPHTCRECGALGAILCGRCKKNLFEKSQPFCPTCKKLIAHNDKCGVMWKCLDCELPFSQCFVGGMREGVLGKMLKEYKYQSVRAIGQVLAELLDNIIPRDFGGSQRVIVVPLPTIGKHVRERGFDHTLVLARKLAKMRGWGCQSLLGRAVDTVQVGTRATMRKVQASKAYVLTGRVENDVTYLLLDDIWTTGASMLAAAKLFEQTTASINAVVVAISKLDLNEEAS